MVFKIIALHADKEPLLWELITHEGMVSQMCLTVSSMHQMLIGFAFFSWLILGL